MGGEGEYIDDYDRKKLDETDDEKWLRFKNLMGMSDFNKEGDEKGLLARIFGNKFNFFCGFFNKKAH